jgi:hypothetical protein
MTRLRESRYSLAIGNLNKWSTDMEDLNQLVKELGLNQVEQELVANEAKRISKKKEWDRAKEAIERALIPFAASEEARSMGLSYRFVVGRDRQLEDLRFESEERAVEIKVPPKISEPKDGIKVLKPYEEDITGKLAKLDDKKTQEFIEGLFRQISFVK